jgi:hypothetical protein
MKNIKSFESFNNPRIIGYHVTNQSNLKKILKTGLEPRIPEDFGEKGDVKGVYLFKTGDDTNNALYNWFGERIEEWEEENDKEFKETILVVDLTGLDLYDSVEFEWTCLEHIPPERIIQVIKNSEPYLDILNDLDKIYNI